MIVTYIVGEMSVLLYIIIIFLIIQYLFVNILMFIKLWWTIVLVSLRIISPHGCWRGSVGCEGSLSANKSKFADQDPSLTAQSSFLFILIKIPHHKHAVIGEGSLFTLYIKRKNVSYEAPLTWQSPPFSLLLNFAPSTYLSALFLLSPSPCNDPCLVSPSMKIGKCRRVGWY